MLEFLESVTAEIDTKDNVDTVYLDLAKALDKVLPTTDTETKHMELMA